MERLLIESLAFPNKSTFLVTINNHLFTLVVDENADYSFVDLDENLIVVRRIWDLIHEVLHILRDQHGYSSSYLNEELIVNDISETIESVFTQIGFFERLDNV